MTYQRQLTDARFEEQLKAARQEQRQFNQSRVKHTNQLEHIRKEAVNKYHSIDKKACQIYAKFKTAGFSDFAADSMCRQAHKYNINPNLDLSQILNAVKAKTAFKPNSTNSKGPDGPGVAPDQQFSPSSYGTDMQSCLDSLNSLGIEPERAQVECETQYAAKGYRGGKTMNASNSEVIPGFVYAITGGNPPNLPNGPSSIKSASINDQVYNYMLLRDTQHKDDINYIPANAEFERLIELRSQKIAAVNRLKQASVKKPVDPRPAWAICANL